MLQSEFVVSHKISGSDPANYGHLKYFELEVYSKHLLRCPLLVIVHPLKQPG